MVGIAILEALLKRPVAVLALRFVNSHQQPLTFTDLRAKLQSKFAVKERELPSEAAVKADLDFLVREKLLEVEGVKYRITPTGVEAARALTPNAVAIPG